ncbi:type II secretion system protein GspK [Belnapia rosea]|nr:type II secretion system protein GspK [Belnapia rosea]
MLAFLSLLGTGVLAGARQNTQRVRNLIDAASVRATSEAALQQTIFALLDPSERRWRVDGSLRELRLGDSRATVQVTDESGKVNPNIAAPELLEALLVQLGVDRRSAARHAAAIVQWRSPAQDAAAAAARAQLYAAAGRDVLPPGTLFDSLDDLAAVVGMTPALQARLRPHLSLFTKADPDRSTTDPVVAAALGLPTPAAAPRDAPGESAVVTVIIRVNGPRGTRYAEQISLRLNGRTDVRRFEILAREVMPWPPGPSSDLRGARAMSG